MTALTRSLTTLLAAALLLAACADVHVPTAPRLPAPKGPHGTPAEAIVHVDLVKGEVTVTPVAQPGFGDGIAGRFYGTSQQIAYRFVYPLAAPVDSAGKRIYTFPLRVENLLPHRVGTITASGPATPVGVHVYIAIPPGATAGCTAYMLGCQVSVYSPDGIGSFTELSQPYLFYNQFLEANDGVANAGPDLSGLRNLRFVADPAITNFAFGVGAKAPWAVEGEHYVVTWTSNWHPFSGTGGPPWSTEGTGSAAMTTTNCGTEPQCLQVTTTSNQNLRVFRTDQLLPSQSAFIDGTVSGIQIPPGNKPTGVMGIADGSRFIQLGVSRTHIGFTNLASSQLDAHSQQHLPEGAVHFRIVKDAPAGMVYLYMDGVLRVSRPYADFPVQTFSGPGPHRTFWFGNDGQGTTRWTNVSYGVGTTSP